MRVIATAGHVDHGKSTLIRRLTGMEPDRWAEERRRGLTIDLGYAWTTLPSGRVAAFVDVPGHARFVPNMLAGVGPVPAVLFVVAADEGWMPQSTEHLDALAALEVADGLLVVNRCDRADPAPAAAQAAERLAGTSLAGIPTVAVSGATGAGIAELTDAVDALCARLPDPDPAADVRLWVDRAFTVRGAGTVVTGTLPGGTVRTGDELAVSPGTARVRVRNLESLGTQADAVSGVARVALNLRGVAPGDLGRGHALLTPDVWLSGTVTDVRLRRVADRLPRAVTVHVGAAAVPATVRRLGPDTARVTTDRALPLRVGDRLLLRDPGAHRILAGALVLDVLPPPLGRRGATTTRAAELAGLTGIPDATSELRRRGLVRAGTLRAMGVPPAGTPVAGDWLADPTWWAGVRSRLVAAVDAHRAAEPLSTGLPLAAAAHALDLPDPALVAAAATDPLTVRDGRVRRADVAPALPVPVARAVAAVHADLAADPYAAPESARLSQLGLGRRELAAAVRAGTLLEVAPGIVLRPGADAAAVPLLAALPQPFTLSEARRALHTTRRVAVPLLEHLDRTGRTRRLADSRREVDGAGTADAGPTDTAEPD
ncbi:selenocysteine-specific translation elongation factor [Actinocatenispora rupis]|uniref:Selenocysteine-specific translation elongation factor n=1 Tax=Actinocatenispora rupis TaxID=519421 RepID=A0A8J3NCQ5_9ACTN|nr:selenocysteine-specific translation elongation factor [Actinocatenispora rupis]GID12037.1 selenocysteine-specific translation elongation factor [Actinocatenispora rupis]